MNLPEFEYLIRKTVTYLDFHSDDASRALNAQWQQVLGEIQRLKRQKQPEKSRRSQSKPPKPE
ncbi:hypothetical protein [Laspinema olomoucense]|uniref:hypothetical protein n=1 Tax=Laspinema olomoucense TaxID=3231600 RepID=UPI0021BAB45B|nr:MULTISPECIES: hypothetical protein [unclassified Laspinema]MCT7975331.1 hypothetical protein [Laspinema sp. D3d]MCT7995887.1 hypothetical protein [Laspinema sp. D3c]